MASFYIVLEVTDSGHTLYPTPYKSLADALAAIKTKWIAFLEENAAVNDTSAELLWDEAVADVTSQNGVVSLYLEKGNNFEIHQMTMP
jgi:ActR/RegA family two-component response regulator